ncbi:recombinase family protein [Roseivivax sediminis]|nr:recombinase family protein [Roseivivax sediminis]
MFNHTSEPTEILLPKRRRVILYARVSSTKQSIDSSSLEEQLVAMQIYARSNRMEVIDVTIDKMSAYGPGSENRPGLQKAIRVAQTQNAAILVLRVDRLSRWLPTVAYLHDRGIRVYAVDLGYVGRTRLREEVLKAQAESDAKSKAQVASQALVRLREAKKRRGRLSREQQRRGVTSNLVRRDRNIRLAAEHFNRLPDARSMTHKERAASLNMAGILLLTSIRTGMSVTWDRNSMRKRWPQIQDEIARLSGDDPYTPGP